MSKTQRRKPMAEINVVPYIDVMLVLLVIFMVTAPMMTQGIKVDLPDADSGPLPVSEQDDILVVSIKQDGTFYMNVGEEEEAVSLQGVAERTGKLLSSNPEMKVLVEGDHTLAYGTVINLMNVLQAAGAGNVGLVTEPPEQ